jgi:hypothetical protein
MRCRVLLLAAGVAVACGRTPEPGTASKGTTPTAAAFHVSPSGSADTDGSVSRPWDLATALSHPGPVQPGDTIWLHGGTYRGSFTSTLAGSDSAQIIVRQAPGERATIDGTLVINDSGASTTYWGFEVMGSNPERPDVPGVDVQAPRTKLVNLVVHDHGGNGIGFWSAAPDAELYGTIVYNNGRQEDDRGHGHGIYAQNKDGVKRIADNVVFNQFSYGIHVYGSNKADIKNFEIEGNASFNNGSLSAKQNAPDLFVGGGSPAEGILVANNFTFRQDGLTTAVFGDADGPMNRDLTLRDNYIVGATKITKWDTVAVTGNTFTGTETLLFLSLAGGPGTQNTWDGNTYVSRPGTWQPFVLSGGSPTRSLDFASWQGATRMDQTSGYRRANPTGVRVFVRPNAYEPGRANIIVYNWDRQPSASVELGTLLPRGARYEVRNVQNYYGAPVAGGTYTGSAISVPMTAAVPPVPVGRAAAQPPVTSPIFNVFVLTTPGAGSTVQSAARNR